jgi:hypothetical protein
MKFERLQRLGNTKFQKIVNELMRGIPAIIATVSEAEPHDPGATRRCVSTGRVGRQESDLTCESSTNGRLFCQLLVQLREYEHESAANQHKIADAEEMEGCVVRQKEPVVTRLCRLPDR